MSNSVLSVKKAALSTAFLQDEIEVVQGLIDAFPLSTSERAKVTSQARDIVTQSRAMKHQQGTLDAFLAEFDNRNRNFRKDKVLFDHWKSVDFLFQLTDEEVRSAGWRSVPRLSNIRRDG